MQAVILILGLVSILTPLSSNKEKGKKKNAKSLDQAWDFSLSFWQWLDDTSHLIDISVFYVWQSKAGGMTSNLWDMYFFIS